MDREKKTLRSSMLWFPAITATFSNSDDVCCIGVFVLAHLAGFQLGKEIMLFVPTNDVAWRSSKIDLVAMTLWQFRFWFQGVAFNTIESPNFCQFWAWLDSNATSKLPSWVVVLSEMPYISISTTWQWSATAGEKDLFVNCPCQMRIKQYQILVLESLSWKNTFWSLRCMAAVVSLLIWPPAEKLECSARNELMVSGFEVVEIRMVLLNPPMSPRTDEAVATKAMQITSKEQQHTGT